MLDSHGRVVEHVVSVLLDVFSHGGFHSLEAAFPALIRANTVYVVHDVCNCRREVTVGLALLLSHTCNEHLVELAEKHLIVGDLRLECGKAG